MHPIFKWKNSSKIITEPIFDQFVNESVIRQFGFDLLHLVQKCPFLAKDSL